MLNISKHPVIILANYRTGSSALTYKLAELNNIEAFVEPSIKEERQDKFKYHQEISNSYVVKFMPDQLEGNEYYKKLLISPSSYIIKLQRKNKIEQIASYYVAKQTKKWWSLKDEPEEKYFVSIDLNELNFAIDYILKIDRMLDEHKSFNLQLYYEDLGFLDNLKLNLRLTSKPLNYQRLLDTIKKRINNV